MKILVACEYSGIVSTAFAQKGHEVISSDFEPTQCTHPLVKHYTGNCLDIIDDNFDMLIAFPPCQWLAQCQLHRKSDMDKLLRWQAYQFVLALWHAPIKKICIENPVGWLNTNWKIPTQMLSPHYFGSPYSKKICFWLKDLPPLMFGAMSAGKKKVANHVNSRMSQALKSKIKSKFFPEVAEAMATQWS